MCPGRAGIRPNGVCTCAGGTRRTKTIAGDPTTPAKQNPSHSTPALRPSRSGCVPVINLSTVFSGIALSKPLAALTSLGDPSYR